MLKQTHKLAGNFTTREDAEIAMAMILTAIEMYGGSGASFKIEKIAENFFRLLQK